MQIPRVTRPTTTSGREPDRTTERERGGRSPSLPAAHIAHDHDAIWSHSNSSRRKNDPSPASQVRATLAPQPGSVHATAC